MARRGGTKSLAGERLVEAGLPGAELAPDFRAEVRRRHHLLIAYALKQRRGEMRGHEETHELAADPLGDIDTDDQTLGRHGRAAAHTRIERAGEMDALVVAALHQPVVGALVDGEAEIERIAHGIEALAFGQTAGHRRLVEREERGIALIEVDDSKIVGKIDRQQLDLAAAAVGTGIFEPVGFRLERHLRDDVIVGDGKPVGGDKKARADRELASAAHHERANLQQPRRGRGIDALRRGRNGRNGFLRLARRHPGYVDRAGADRKHDRNCNRRQSPSGMENARDADDQEMSPQFPDRQGA